MSPHSGRRASYPHHLNGCFRRVANCYGCPLDELPVIATAQASFEDCSERGLYVICVFVFIFISQFALLELGGTFAVTNSFERRFLEP